MRVAVTGASGFLGGPLCVALRAAGHTVTTIGRGQGASTEHVTWDPERGSVDLRRLEGVDAVVHLAGEPIGQRWTPRIKQAIAESRVHGTRLVARMCAELSHRPSVLLSMSAVGYYGDRGDELLDDQAARGRGFLAEVAEQWEAAADQARAAGIRVVHPRLGIVLHRAGGALERMLPVFSLGLGGAVGSGRQWWSWISRSDAVRGLQFLLEAPLVGACNLVAPAPATNAEFTHALARALRRPALMTVPAFAVRLAFGEMGQATILDGQRCLPNALLHAGFQFEHPDLTRALRAALDEP
jgi:hypothetical protein